MIPEVDRIWNQDLFGLNPIFYVCIYIYISIHTHIYIYIVHIYIYILHIHTSPNILLIFLFFPWNIPILSHFFKNLFSYIP